MKLFTKDCTVAEGCYRNIGLVHTPDLVHTLGLVRTMEPVYITCLILAQWNIVISTKGST